MASQVSIQIRPVVGDDCNALCALLNAIIERGGTTAHQTLLTLAHFAAKFIENPHNITCLVACLEDGTQLGFQHVARNSDLPENWGDISTFALIDSPVRGVGTALFEATKKAARQASLVAIYAKIRADNVPGLGYYSKMGFVDYAVAEAVPLADGTPVDRISKKFHLN